MSSSELVFTLRNQRNEIDRMFSLIEAFCQENRVSEDDLFKMRLVLDEAVINVIVHGYEDTAEHAINVSLSLLAGVLTIQVDDDGMAYNPLSAPAPRFDLHRAAAHWRAWRPHHEDAGAKGRIPPRERP